MHDVPALYARYGVRVPDVGSGWVSVNCFSGRHRDRHKSARVHLVSGGFRCFACNEAGGVLDALQLLGERDRDRAREIATEYGIEIRRRRRPPLPGVHRAPVGPAGPPTPVTAQTERDLSKTSAGFSTNLAAHARGTVDWSQVRRPAPAGPTVYWTYHDAHGDPVGRVARSTLADGGKRIWAERHESGRYVPGLAGTPLPLYRLPEVLRRAHDGGEILVVEGEKCVAYLDRLGKLATCNPGGAGKWRETYSAAFQGAGRVTVIADCDTPGRRHALQVTQHLLGSAVNVTMPLDLAPYNEDGFDIADLLADLTRTIRGTTPEASRWRVRWLLLGHVDALLRDVLPANAEALRAKLELLEFRSSPEGKELHDCPTCGRTRPHRIMAGFAYCPCGGKHPLREGAVSTG